jgi:NAD(P)-dependent dehydrogenase (short-subunit alcohol dehydrogenase family)
MSLDAGVALVTGASRGLGAAIAAHLARQGHPVAVNYHAGAAAARQVVDAIRGAGGTAEAFSADVTDEAQVSDLVEAVRRRLGPVDVLVVNATGPQPELRVEDLTWQAHLDQLVYFVKSPTLLVQAVLPRMKATRHGRIIQIGSDSVERALPETSAYVAAKSAQLGLTRTWARELGPHNITVNLVAPGWVPVERHGRLAPSDYEQYVAEVPLGRLGRPADVAAAVSYLASDAAAFITGERIGVNGDHTLR